MQYEATVPTVADRIAQTVVAMYLEPLVEPHFHPDSYGYRPKKSALQAVGVARERCWRFDWVIDLDIRGFFRQSRLCAHHACGGEVHGLPVGSSTQKLAVLTKRCSRVHVVLDSDRIAGDVFVALAYSILA